MRHSWLWTRLAILVILCFTSLATAQDDSSDDGLDVPKETVFNGQVVPPMEMLTSENIRERIKDGYWLVEFYSPYCPHCLAMAPAWQTMYEFYYTSDPLASSSTAQAEALNSFTGYYNFHFAKVDCIAFGDACTAFNARNYPSVVLFRGGVEVPDTRIKGAYPISKYVELIESTLEAIKPGSRSPDGPRLPEVGANHSPDYDPSVPKPALGPKEGTMNTKGVTLQLPKSEANREGVSVPLSSENFANLVGNQKDVWFIKFYAPWCGHCQAMAPNWEAMARSMKDKLNIGEVNCDQHGALCRMAGISSFPTLMLFRGTDSVEYEGGRSTGDLIDYTTQIVDVGTRIVDVTKASFAQIQSSAPVWFIYFYDNASTSEDVAMLDRLVLQVAGHARIVKTQDRELAKDFGVVSWPRLAVSRSGKKTLYPGTSPTEMRDIELVSAWMRAVRYPLVPELTPANAAALMGENIVVLTILSRDRPEEMNAIQKSLLETALVWAETEEAMGTSQREELRLLKQNRIQEAKSRGDLGAAQAAAESPIPLGDYANRPVQFAWVDGVYWQRWIYSTYGIDTREIGLAVVINDEKNHRFWDRTSSGDPLSPSRSTLLETLPLVVTRPPILPARSSRSGPVAWYFSIRAMYEERPMLKWYTVAFILILAIFLFRRSRRTSNGRGVSGGLSGRRPVGLPGPNAPAHAALFDPEKFSMASLWGRPEPGNGKVD